MAKRVGIVLASGKAMRWGGVAKELMPTAEHEWIIDWPIYALMRADVDQIIVVTSVEKIAQHAAHFGKDLYNTKPIVYAVRYEGEMWNAILAALPHCGDINFLTMADTIIPPTTFQNVPEDAPLSLGTFRTQEPRRFSVVYDGKIFTKPSQADGEYAAWGTFAFHKDVAHFWLKGGFTHYDTALNAAIERCGLATYQMAYYHDIADFGRLLDYIQWRKTYGAG
jgi:dTDP-glucose pyrophosphorylase